MLLFLQSVEIQVCALKQFDHFCIFRSGDLRNPAISIATASRLDPPISRPWPRALPSLLLLPEGTNSIAIATVGSEKIQLDGLLFVHHHDVGDCVRTQVVMLGCKSTAWTRCRAESRGASRTGQGWDQLKPVSQNIAGSARTSAPTCGQAGKHHVAGTPVQFHAPETNRSKIQGDTHAAPLSFVSSENSWAYIQIIYAPPQRPLFWCLLVMMNLESGQSNLKRSNFGPPKPRSAEPGVLHVPTCHPLLIRFYLN